MDWWNDPALWPDPLGDAPAPAPDAVTAPLPDPEVGLEPRDTHDPYTGEPWEWIFPSL